MEFLSKDDNSFDFGPFIVPSTYPWEIEFGTEKQEFWELLFFRCRFVESFESSVGFFDWWFEYFYDVSIIIPPLEKP